MHEVSESVGELGVVHCDHGLLTERNVCSKGGGVGEVAAECVARVPVELLVRINHVAQRLGHLLALLVVDEAVRVDALGQGYSRAHMHGGPDDRVEPYDVLADQMNVARPVLHIGPVRVVSSREVVCECVEPYVHYVLLVALQLRVLGHGHAPVKGRAGDGKVAEGLLQASENLVAPVVRLDELVILLNVLDKPLLVLAHAEEVALLSHLLQRHTRRRVLVVGLLCVVFCHKCLLPDIVPALISIEVNVTSVNRALEQLLGSLLVLVHRGSDVKVVGNVHSLVENLERLRVLVANVNRLQTHRFGRLGNLLTVLIRASAVEDVAAKHPVPPCNDVRGHCLVRMPHVWVAVCVVDGSCDVETLPLGVLGGQRGEQPYRVLELDLLDGILATLQLAHTRKPVGHPRELCLILRGHHPPPPPRRVQPRPHNEVRDPDRRPEGFLPGGARPAGRLQLDEEAVKGRLVRVRGTPRG
mmetsp:Transcript_49961/g.121278  ORF Transcript_49961/g.121278 Transcript_49961/m.121278 type:complete len:471 (-) Transcript_49961:320-1732(-)